MESRVRASAAVESSSFCPACDKPVDSLRAGQVAILDGTFRYFCNAACKNAYVDVLSKRASLDAMTAEPPVVSASRGALPPSPSVRASNVQEQSSAEETPMSGALDPRLSSVRSSPREPYFPPSSQLPEDPSECEDSGVRAQSSSEATEFEPSPRPPSGHAVAPVSERALPADIDDDLPDEAVVEEGLAVERSPSTLRSPADTGVEPRPQSGTIMKMSVLVALASRHGAAVAPFAGVFAGVLASVISLAGEQVAVLRFPLAVFAGFIFIILRVLGPREHAEPALWVALGPVGLAMIVASVSFWVHDPHADAHAMFVGLAAAAALTVDILLARARRDVAAARARTSRALSTAARVVRGDEVVEVDASVVKPGEQVIVEAGETIPVDGIVVVAEDAEVAPWLDSPSLVRKSDGDAVVAGAVVVSGRLRLNATFCGAERAWLRLAEAPLRSDSLGNGATSAKVIEVTAPLVAFARSAVERGAPAAAVLVAGAVYANNGSWLDVAIAASGGAYALATASAVSAAALAHARGHASAQRRGIVYKDAAAFDAAARADVAVVCSRGTILLGEPEIVVVEAITKDGVSPNGWLRSPTPSLDSPSGKASEASPEDKSDISRVLAIAAGAEMSSTHPFASAILREARARGVGPDNVRSALGHSGLGVTALAANGERVIVGSRAFLLQEKVSVAIADYRTSELESQGRSVLLVAVGGRLVGLLALQDGLRPGARAAIQRLHDARIEPVLLSGEARETCETIARALDIEHVRPEILPIDRGAEVRALADGGRIVAALGHAATDDGALGAADVSIAMEAAGSAPGEWGVLLASDDVRDAVLALTVPRACRDRARIALVVGGLTHALGAFGVAFGIAPAALMPVLAVLAASAVVVVVREPAVAPD